MYLHNLKVTGGVPVPKFRPLTIAIAMITLVAVPAAAYQIGSHVPTKEYFNLHETITSVATECLGPATVRPSDCSSRFGEIGRRTRQRQGSPDNSFEYASRWPDDPTRMLDRYPSKVRFGLQMNSDCARALQASRSIDNAGLLCSSHYGRLQFMHAQATREDAGSAKATRDIILDWATFAYRAATEPEFRKTNYCDAVQQEDAGLRTALALSNDSLCKPRRRWFLGIIPAGSYDPWSVGTFFSLHCPNPGQEAVCWERTGEYGEQSARAAAIGALLHLVQDSYSQSHVARVPNKERTPGPRGPFEARVVCQAPSAYYDYEAQNRDTPDDVGNRPEDPHAVADFAPTLHESCSNAQRSVDDVITASAAILYFAQLPTPDVVAFRRYLETRVFPE